VSYKHYEKCEECKDETTCTIRKVFFEVRNNSVALLKDATLEKMISN
jgi:DNA-binding IscR family transcriptional regulator